MRREIWVSDRFEFARSGDLQRIVWPQFLTSAVIEAILLGLFV
jgi:hypothetical protein